MLIVTEYYIPYVVRGEILFNNIAKKAIGCENMGGKILIIL